MKKNILILANTFYPVLGGVETHLLDLLKEVALDNELKIHLIAYSYKGSSGYQSADNNSNIHIKLLGLCSKNPNSWLNWLEYHIFPFYILYNTIPFFVYTFFYCLKNGPFDVIHVNSHSTGLVGLVISKLFHIKKKLISMHGIMFSSLNNFQQYNKHRLRIKKQFLLFDKIFCIGRRSFEEVNRLMNDDASLVLFRYWVQERFFQVTESRMTAKSALHLEDRKVIFFAGRLIETKGIPLLLEVAKQMPQYDFMIAGGGRLERLVQQHSKKFDNIKYLGKIANELLPLYLRAADVSILLTQGDGEGIPRALIESVACGTPIIATARGGTEELIAFGTGLIVDNDKIDIQQKITTLLTNQVLHNKLSVQCVKVAERYFSKTNATIIINEYKAI